MRTYIRSRRTALPPCGINGWARAASLALALIVGACGDAASTAPPAASPAIRAVQIRALLGFAPPTTLADARLVEETLGAGGLGPTDYRAFLYLKVAPGDIDAWTRRLQPTAAAEAYARPTASAAWWLSPARFARCELYRPPAGAWRSLGWIAVDRAGGGLYWFSYTA